MSAAMKEYALQLRQLAEEYYQRQYSFEDYRVRRKRILDQMEAEHSGKAEPGGEGRPVAGDVPSLPPDWE